MSETYPDVPNAPGVPEVARPQQVVNVDFVAPLSADGPGVSAATSALPAWGITDATGEAVITPDSFKSFEFTAEWLVSDYPQEGGAFQSYNKVQRPFEARMVMLQGGTDSERAVFLQTVQIAIEALDLYTVSTPEATYQSVNVTHYDYRKTDKDGVTLLSVEVWMRQIRVTATAAFSNTAQPSGTAKVNDGAVQTQTPPTVAFYGSLESLAQGVQ